MIPSNEPVKLTLIEKTKGVRLVKTQEWPARVYTLLMLTPNHFYGHERYTTQHQTHTWSDSGEVWDCTEYIDPPKAPIHTSPNSNDEPQWYDSMDDLVAAFKAAGVPWVQIIDQPDTGEGKIY